MNTGKVDFDKLNETADPQEKALQKVVDMEFELVKNLIKRRKELGMTQGDVAAVTGMDQQAVSRMEKFGSKPITSTLVKYLVALKIDINILFEQELK